MTLLDRLFKWASIAMAIAGCVVFLLVMWIKVRENPISFLVMAGMAALIVHLATFYRIVYEVHDLCQRVDRLESDRRDE